MAKRVKTEDAKPTDMTPMIDMVFQLLIFFVILVNFSDADNNQRIKLPKSDLAKPPEKPIEDAVTIQVAQAAVGSRDYVIILGANEIKLPRDLGSFLKTEIAGVQKKHNNRRNVKDMTIVIRSDGSAKTGFIQEIIQVCQQNGLEKFALRAQHNEK